MIYEKTIQDNTCSIKNLDTNVLNIKVYFNKYYHDNIDDSTDFNDYVLISERNLQSNQVTNILLNEDGNYNIVLFNETLNYIDTINVQRYVNYRMSMIKDFFIAFNQRGNKFYNKIGIENYPRNLQNILNEHISIESIMNYAFLNNYFNNDYFTAYLQEAYKQYKFLFIPDTLGQRQYLNLMGKYNMEYNLIPKIASIFMVGFYLMEIYSNTDITLNNTYSIYKLKRGLHKLGLTFETLENIFYINAPIPSEKDPNIPITATVITNTASNITQTSVRLNGLTNPDGHIITERGFEWKEASSNTYNIVVSTSINNTFSVDINNLSVGTAYIFKAYIKVNEVTIYGDEITFNTNNAIITPPIVITNSATSIIQTSATLNGIITAGTEPIISKGFEWKVASSNTWLSITINESVLTHNLLDLTLNTAYQFRAYATTNTGTVYGTTQNFTTLAVVPPTVVTSPATAISQNTATINGTVTVGSGAIIVQGFEWKLSSASTWTTITTTINGNAITHNLLGLTPNTAYQYRAYATTASGTTFGNVITFTTLEEIITIYYGTIDTVPTTVEEVVNRNSTTLLTFTTDEINENVNFIAFPTTLSLQTVENADFVGDFWYDKNNDLYTSKTVLLIDGKEYNIYSMTTFMPIGVKANVILNKI